MNESVYQQLMAAAARRELTAAEEAQLRGWLAAHPELVPSWREEQQLTTLLRQLPDVPVASNFTAQVLQAVDRTPGRRTDAGLRAWWRVCSSWRYGWQAAAVMIVAAVALGLHYEQAHTRAELARSFATLPVAGLSDVELWQNFDAIRSLPEGPLPSVEELAEAVK